MAQDEVIRYVYEVSGSKELRDVAKQLLETGGASEEAQADVRKLAEEFGALAKQASDAQGLQSSVETFRKLSAEVLATQRQITAAKTKITELSKAIAETEEPTKKQTREFESARKELENLGRQQTAQRAKLSELKAGFSEAGISARNLGAAERELATRLQASEQAMAGVIAGARNSVTARKQAAAAEQALLDQLRKTAAVEAQAARAAESLQRAREILAQRSAAATGTERTYAAALGTSAAKIAAIGAAAIGINSAVGLARSGISALIETAGEFQKLDVQLEGVFGGQAPEALTAIQQFAKETPYQLQQVADSFVKLKAFGLDPLNGTFDAIADQAAKLGGSQETLTGITLALGQAQAKQKLQGEEILQLVERGVPVWDLLSRATGKNVQELQKLSEAGKLGRAEIALLIEEIGKSADGAAGALATTLPGQINRLKGQWAEFLNLIANSGVLDYLQEQLAAVSEEVTRMAATGELQAWAKEVADAIVGAAQAIQGAVGFLYDHREAILALAAAYAGFKAVSLIGNLATAFAGLATRVIASTTALTASTVATSAMLGPLGLLAAALAFTANATINLVDGLQKINEANAEAAAAELDLLDTQVRLAIQSKKLQIEYKAFADVVVRESSELARQSESDTQAYITQLEGAIQYTAALGTEAIATGDEVGKLAAKTRLTELRAALAEAKQRMIELREESELSFDTLGAVGLAAATAFDDLIAKGKSAKEAVSGIFKDLDFTQAESLATAAVQIEAIGRRGTEAGRAVRDELRAQILKLSDEDFAKFKLAAASAFTSTFQGSEQLKNSLAGINLERLGVDLEEIKTGFSRAGRIAIDAFKSARTEIDQFGLTAEQRAQAIGIAFDDAFGKAKTKADFQALGDELIRAFDQGQLGIDDYSKRLDEVKAKIASVGKPSAGGGGDGSGDAGKQTFEQASVAAENLGDKAVETGDKIASSGQGISSAAQAIQNIYAGFANELGKISEAAVQRFTGLTRDIFELSAGIADFSGLARFGKAAQDAYDIVTKEVEKQKIGVAALADQYANLSDDVIQAMARTRGGVDNVAAGFDLLAQNAREGVSEFDLLDQQDLSQLAGAAQQAADRVRQIGEAAEASKQQLSDLASSFKDQIDQINGNQESVENRRFQNDLKRLEELRKAAGDANLSEYNEAVAAAERLHQLKLKQIREQEAAARRANENSSQGSNAGSSSSASGSPRPTGGSGAGSTQGGGIPVNINLGGQSAPISVNSQAELNRLLALLRQAGLASGNGGSLLG